jgi:hypothetical protein
MHLSDHILNKFPNPELGLQTIFKQARPTPNIVLDNFLPKETALELARECASIPSDAWTKFTRNGSSMEECKTLTLMQSARRAVEELNGSAFIGWLERVTGVQGLIADPHLTGAGYSRSYAGDTLQIHNDFNWNEQLKLHRTLSVIIYLSPGWNPEWGGGLDFYDQRRQNVVKTVDCLYNRMLVWQYHPRNFHGYTTPLSCPSHITRNTLRLFYYTSNSTHNPQDPPHRSQYWYDAELDQAYDLREER